MLSPETAALRADLAVVMKLVAGESPRAKAARSGCEAAVASFTARAVRLQQAFAAARLRMLVAGTPDAIGDATSLRADIDALQHEISVKDAVLATHRARVQRWCVECEAVQATAESLSEVVMPEAYSEHDEGGRVSTVHTAVRGMLADEPLGGNSVDEDEDEVLDEFD